MNYQTIINLQLRPLLKKIFHSSQIALRHKSGEKILFSWVGITRLNLMLTKNVE